MNFQKYTLITSPPIHHAKLGPKPISKSLANLTTPIYTFVTPPMNILSTPKQANDTSRFSSLQSQRSSPDPDYTSSSDSDCSSSPNSSNQRRYRVGGIVLDTNGHLLIVFGRQSRKWSLPKGGLNQGEDFLTGALREIWEETGFKMKPDTNHQQTISFWSINKARIYILRLNQQAPTPKPVDKNEIEKAIWLNLNNLQQVNQIKEKANKMLVLALNRLQGMQVRSG